MSLLIHRNFCSVNKLSSKFNINSQLRWFSSSKSRPSTTYEVSAADLQFGQPIHETHPHIVKPGCITPEISAQEYYDRRVKLASNLPPNSVAILPSSIIKYRSGPVFHKFHQDSSFFYLTGFDEPNSLAVIDNRPTRPLLTLFVREKDPRSELWEGARSGTIAARDVFNADESYDVNQLSTTLPQLLNGVHNVFTDIPKTFRPRDSFETYISGIDNYSTRSTTDFSNQSQGILGLLGRLSNSGTKISTAEDYIANLRLIKSDSEISAMRWAGKIAGRSHTNVMRKSWDDEAKLRVQLMMGMMEDKCENEAYIPVVGAGKNALSIHYVRNDSIIDPNQMVLVDAGSQYGGYISDITRTWPVSGKFTDPQKDLYSMVLQVQRTCVSLCHEISGLSLDKIHRVAEQGLKKGLEELGFDMSGNSLSLLFPHHVGHYIGLDVHDTPSIRRTEPFRKNMCITVEPGIYVPDDERWPKHFRNIGVRIEDSIAIDTDSPHILTTEAVKEVVDIEALRR